MHFFWYELSLIHKYTKQFITITWTHFSFSIMSESESDVVEDKLMTALGEERMPSDDDSLGLTSDESDDNQMNVSGSSGKWWEWEK